MSNIETSGLASSPEPPPLAQSVPLSRFTSRVGGGSAISVDMHTSPQSRISPTVLSSTLIAFSVLWFLSAYVFYLTNRSSKDGVFGAPVWALLFLTLIPVSTFLLAPWLIRARRVDGQRLRSVDYCALVAGVAPFLFVGALVLFCELSR